MTDFVAMSVDERLDSCIDLLHKHGPTAVPETMLDVTLAAEVERLSDPDGGLEYYGIHYGLVWVKGRGWQRFCPDGKPRVSKTGKDWSWQPKFWGLLNRFYILLVIKARQLGLTFGCALTGQWAAQWLGLSSEQVIAVVTNKMANSKRLVRKSREMYRRQPAWLNALSPMVMDGITRLEYANGSSIEPFAGNEDASRAEAASLVLVDEVGKIEHLDEVFASLEACADNGGRIIMWGTANARESGVGSYLHQMVIDATAGDIIDEIVHPTPNDGNIRMPVYSGLNEINFIFLPWMLHADRDDRWFERKRRMYRGNLAKFDAEYPRQWEDAFIGAGTAYFDYRALRKQIETLSVIEDGSDLMLWETRDRRGTFLWENRERNIVKFVEDPYGHVVLHFKPEEFEDILKARRPFVIPADCAGDDFDGDFHAAHAIRVGNVPMFEDDVVDPKDFLKYEQFATIHGHMDADEYGELLVRMAWFFGGALIAPEMNGVGVAVAKCVKRLGYPYMYTRRTKPDNKRDKPVKKVGWYSGEHNKEWAYGETERLIRNGWFILRDIATLNEMVTIRTLKGGTIGAPKPKKDDRSDAATIGIATSPQAHHFDHRVIREARSMHDFEMEDVFAELEEAEHSRKFLGSDQQGILDETWVGG